VRAGVDATFTAWYPEDPLQVPDDPETPPADGGGETPYLPSGSVRSQARLRAKLWHVLWITAALPSTSTGAAVGGGGGALACDDGFAHFDGLHTRLRV
jgi:hypothetical protein